MVYGESDATLFLNSFLLGQFFDGGHIFEGGGIAGNAAFLGQFAEEATHYFSAAGFGQQVSKAHFGGPCNGANNLRNVIAETGIEFS